MSKSLYFSVSSLSHGHNKLNLREVLRGIKAVTSGLMRRAPCWRTHLSSQGSPPGIRDQPSWHKWGPLCRAVLALELPEGLQEAVTGLHCSSVLPLPDLSPFSSPPQGPSLGHVPLHTSLSQSLFPGNPICIFYHTKNHSHI